MLKIVSENFIHALLLFLGLFLKISRWVPLHSNVRFTIDKFEDENVYFFDISLDRTTTDIYRKDKNTGQYVSFSSYEPWPLVFYV